MKQSIGYVKKTKLNKTSRRKNPMPSSLPKLLWFIYPLVYIIFFQSMAEGSLFKGLGFMLFNLYSFVVTYLLILFVGIALWWLIDNKWLSFSILNIAGLAITLGSRITLTGADTGLAINNLEIFNELELIKNTEGIVFLPLIIIMLVAIPVLYLGIYFMYDWKPPIKHRKLSGVLIALIFLFFSQVLVPGITLSKNKLADVDQLGIILFFNNGFLSKDEMKYPNEGEVDRIMKPVLISERDTAIKPNVIMIQIDNFIDTIRLGDNNDASLSNFHSLFDGASRYLVDVPNKQDDNLNLEFEALAGLPSDYYPNDSQVRGGNTTKGTISLGSIFSSIGYVSYGIMPYSDSANQAGVFYRNLGFDEFIGIDDLGNDKPEGVLDGIKTSLEENSDKPVFIFSDFNILKQKYLKMSDYEESLKLLDGYLFSLKELVAASKQPTIIIIYSGGLPVLGDNNNIYYEKGYLEAGDTEIEKTVKLNTGDLIIWNNYNRTAPVTEGEKFNLSGLAEVVLTYGNFNMPNYFYYTNYLKNEMKISGLSTEYLEMDDILYAKGSKVFDEIVSDYIVICKDVLGPNKFVEDDLERWIR